MLEARLLLVRSRWKAQQHEPNQADILSALAAATKAVELNAESADSLIEKSRALYFLAIMLKGAAREARIVDGLAAVEQGLKVNATSGPLLAMKAVLLQEKAALVKEMALAEALRKESQESWSKALAVNPLLKREYEAYLREK